MKLYPRQLNSLEDLKREKRFLKYAARHSGDWLSFDTLTKSAGTSKGFDMIGSIATAVGSKSATGALISFLPSLMGLFSKKSRERKKSKRTFDSLPQKILMGYIKWKAVEWGVKTISKMIHARKKKEKD